MQDDAGLAETIEASALRAIAVGEAHHPNDAISSLAPYITYLCKTSNCC
jgi:hypothetical protein